MADYEGISKDEVIERLCRMLRARGSTWVRAHDDVGLEARVRDIVHDGITHLRENSDVDWFGTGGVHIRRVEVEDDYEQWEISVGAASHWTDSEVWQ